MKRRHIFIAIGVSLILLILGSFFDLQISQGLYVGDNFFVLLLTGIGQYPLYGALGFLSGVVMFSVSKLYKSVPFRILAISCGVILTCLCGFLQGKQLYDYDALGALAPNLYKIYIYVPTGLVLMLPMVYLGYLLNQKIQLNQAQFVKTVILIVGICLAFTLSKSIKPFIDRPRYAYIHTFMHEPELFTNWWKPFKNVDHFISIDGVDKDLFRSFPSGHATCGAMTMLMLPMLSLYIPKLENKKVLLFYVGLTYALLISFVRIIQGSHYLTDVAFGMLISVVFIYLTNEFVIRDAFVRKEANN